MARLRTARPRVGAAQARSASEGAVGRWSSLAGLAQQCRGMVRRCTMRHRKSRAAHCRGIAARGADLPRDGTAATWGATHGLGAAWARAGPRGSGNFPWALRVRPATEMHGVAANCSGNARFGFVLRWNGKEQPSAASGRRGMALDGVGIAMACGAAEWRSFAHRREGVAPTSAASALPCLAMHGCAVELRRKARPRTSCAWPAHCRCK